MRKLYINCTKIVLDSLYLQQCTLSAKDRGATKNQAVDLELILMHHFSRILRLDFSSVLSTALNSLLLLLHASQQSLKIRSTKSAKKRHLCASISVHGLHGVPSF